MIVSCYFVPSKDLREQLRDISDLINDFRDFQIVLPFHFFNISTL